MNVMQNAKYVRAVSPTALVNTATATATVIDTRGYEYATIICQLGATDIALSALKVQQSTTSGGTYSDIPTATFSAGASVGGATLALPTALDDNKVFVFQIDMRGKEPFLQVVATFGTGAAGGFISCSAVLTRAEVAPFTGLTMADGGVCRVL